MAFAEKKNSKRFSERDVMDIFPKAYFLKKELHLVFFTPNEVVFRGAVGTLLPKISQHSVYFG